MGYIYTITNKINGKIYIGLTQKTPQERWKMHVNTAYNKNSKDFNALFKKAIRKYGKDNFIIETIEECNTIEELKEKEIYWIKKLKTYAFEEDNWGYNSTKAGDYATNAKKVYQINIITGDIVKEFNSIKEGEEQTGAGDINAVLLRGYGEQPLNSQTTWVYKYLYDEYIPQEHYEQYGIICQLDLQGKFIKYWFGPKEASIKLNITQGNISSCLTGNRKQAGNYQWCYYKDLQNKINKPYQDTRSYNKKPVNQFDLCNNFIKTWESATAAAKELKIQGSKITAVCKGSRKTTGGFIWKYKED